MPNDYGKVKTIVTIALAGIFAAFTIYYMIKGEAKFRKFQKQEELEKIQRMDNWLSSIQKDIFAGKLYEAQEQLSSMKNLELNRNQKKKRFILLGEVALKNYSKHLKSAHFRNYYTDIATKYFKLAIELADKNAEKHNISRRTAKIYMDEGTRQDSKPKWLEALGLLRNTRKYLLKPEQRWEVMIDEAKCLLYLKETGASINLLDKIIDETENETSPDIHEMTNKARRQKADIYYKLSIKPEKLKEYNDELKKAKLPQLTAKKAEEKAVSIYKHLMKNLSILSSQMKYAQLGLMRVYTKNKDKDKSYTLINRMLETNIPPATKAKALVLMAELQEKLHKPEEAIDSLEIAKNSYETSATAELIASKLYDLYLDQKEYDKLLEISNVIFTQHQNVKLIKKIINDVFLGKSPVMAYIKNSPDKNKILNELIDMFLFLRDKVPEVWNKIRNDAQFVSAQLSYYQGNYDLAEKKLVTCLNTIDNSKKLQESIAFLDIQCGLKQKRPDGISICRSLCYLQQFPQGVHYQDVLSILLDKYYDSGMYEAALNTAKKIYVDEISKFNSGKQEKFNKELWLKTVAKIGQCYDKLGSYDNSNRIIRSYCFQLMNEPFAADVFIDWANVAYKKGQLKEAIRRLDIILPKLKKDSDFQKVKVAQFLLILKNTPSYPYSRYRTLIKQISKSKELTKEEKNHLAQTTYEGILNYALQDNNLKQTYNILKKVIKDFPKAKWPEYWILRYLTEIFKKDDLKALSAQHQKTLESDMVVKADRPNTYNFIKNQLELINSLETLDEVTTKLRKDRNLN